MGINSSFIDDINYLKSKEKSRDIVIFDKYSGGATIKSLSEEYDLSPRFIQSILKNQRLLRVWKILNEK